MISRFSSFGAHASAAIGAFMHTRSPETARMRALAVGAAFSGIFLVSTSSIALAQIALPQQTLEDYSKTVSGNTNVVVDIVAYVCYLGGAILSAVGIVDLKKHVENPTQTPLKNGLAKLGFGGILLGLPFVSGIMLETMKGSSQATYQDFDRSGIGIQ